MISPVKNFTVLKEAFYRIFAINDPFGRMFVPSIMHKLLLYPTSGMHRLTEQQYASLMQAIKTQEESSFYLSEIEGSALTIDDNSDLPDYAWEISIDTPYCEYAELPIALENAFFSLNGKWGAIISMEDHVVFGGPEEFIEKIKQIYPEWKNDQKKFVEYFEYYASQGEYKDLSWIPDFLKYINK